MTEIPRLSVSELCGRALRLGRELAGTLVPLAVVLLGPPAAASIVALLLAVPGHAAIVDGGPQLATGPDAGPDWAFLAVAVCALAVCLFAYVTTLVAAVRVAALGLFDRRAGVRDGLRFAREAVVPAAGLWLIVVVALAATAGAVALSPPTWVAAFLATAAVYGSVRLARTLPAIALDGGVLPAALRWSWVATRKRWWVTFAPLALVACAPAAAAVWAAAQLGGPFAQTAGVLAGAAIVVASAVSLAPLLTMLFLNGHRVKAYKVTDSAQARERQYDPESGKELAEVNLGALRARLGEEQLEGADRSRGRLGLAGVAAIAALFLAPAAIHALTIAVNPWDLPASTIADVSDAPEREGALSERYLLSSDVPGSAGLARGEDGPVVIHWEAPGGTPPSDSSDSTEARYTGRLRLVRCGDSRCATRTSERVRVDEAGSFEVREAGAIDAALAGGRLTVAYFEPFEGAPAVLTCELRRCNETRVVARLVDAPVGGPDTATVDVAIDRRGNPVVGYAVTDGELQWLDVASCSNATCTSSETNRVLKLGSVGFDWEVDLELGPDGLPVLAYFDWHWDSIELIRCFDRACAGNSTASLVDLGDRTATDLDLVAAGGAQPAIRYRELEERESFAARSADKRLTCRDEACGAEPGPARGAQAGRRPAEHRSEILRPTGRGPASP